MSANVNTPGLPDFLISAREVLRLNGNISNMTLWRRLSDPEKNFPRPVLINGRRYWWHSKMRAHLAAQQDEAGASVAPAENAATSASARTNVTNPNLSAPAPDTPIRAPRRAPDVRQGRRR